MPGVDDSEYPIHSAYTSAEVTGVDYHEDKYTTETVREAHKQITRTDLLKPILKNLEKYPLSSDKEQVVSIDMVLEG